ncbi:conjugative transposon protein TraN [Cytophagaceae bacterium DM2B3-1]|uniref:Conjugative transposon protein TraN n=1 Tax=Xanthocytophaga flava TaxID=3048013 RepID=A0ABT7CJI8_9BACT|nr:conjugative transposon protein TraN [Xanthocytophaga flavus]MDJ1493686.1 conjugative transposon protein TraN [Xanthocytophaga flavus]
MKTICLAIISLFLISKGFGQSTSPTILPSYPLSITHQKTTTLIFPYAIKSVDRGSQDILAQKASGVENVLWIKAAQKQIEQTNLTVITTDGNVYSYLVNYAPNPTVLTLSYSASNQLSETVHFSEMHPNQAQLKTTCQQIMTRRKLFQRKKDSHFGISLHLEGIYIQDEVLYYRIRLHNQTAINYTMDQFRFSIHDQKQAKRTATQEQELLPIYTYSGADSTQTIKAHSQQTFVVVLDKFTISDQKYVLIESNEKNGGRHLHLRIRNRTLVKPIPIAN